MERAVAGCWLWLLMLVVGGSVWRGNAGQGHNTDAYSRRKNTFDGCCLSFLSSVSSLLFVGSSCSLSCNKVLIVQDKVVREKKKKKQ